MAGVLFHGINALTPPCLNSSGLPILSIAALFPRRATEGDIAHFRDTSVVYGLELFAAVATVFSPRYRWRSSAVAIYVGNNESLGAMAMGDSFAIPVARIISFIRYTSAVLNLSLLVGRVPSEGNIADSPRGGYPFLSSLGVD